MLALRGGTGSMPKVLPPHVRRQLKPTVCDLSEVVDCCACRAGWGRGVSLRCIEAIGLNEQFSGVNEQVWRLFFLDRPVGGTFCHISSVNCPSAVEQPLGKVMIAGWRSKTVAFVAILALLTFGALAAASAFPSRPDEKEAKAEDVTPAAAQAL